MIPAMEPGSARAVLYEFGFKDYARPWADHAARLIKEHGIEADFMGFEAWFVEELGDPWQTDLEVAWDEMGIVGRISLYTIISAACLEVTT